MLSLIVNRILWAIPTLIFVSFISFVIIQLPPGDYVTAYVAQLRHSGEYITELQEAAMRQEFGLNDPLLVQYWRWISAIVMHGDFGRSLEWNMDVKDMIWDRLGLTLAISTLSMIFTWIIAIPIGVYSATRRPSRAGASRTAPRACPSFNVERGFSLTKVSSTAASEGLKLWMTPVTASNSAERR